ncbi:STAS domain-containing protein [Saccharothrix saharensis]|uniref:STAS domain-containing protein n=1 Tax=Saccharothrix saharensis TaxID=571190 RepID=UPI0036788DDA
MDDRVTHIGPVAVVVHTESDGVLITSVKGEVDQDSVEVVRAELATGLDRRPTALVVDLDGVEFFGSLGITALLEAWERAARLGVGFAVAASRRPALRTLEVTDMVEVLRVRRTIQEALVLARSAA